MKKLLSLLFIVLSFSSLVGCKKNNETDDRPTLTVGMECDYAPFNWTESEKSDTNYPIDGSNFYAEGYDVQIAKKIADSLDYRLVIKAISWDGLIAALEANQIDLIIAGMSDTAERRLSVDFTNAYYKSTHVLVMPKNSKYINGKTLNDFSGAKVVGQKNTLYDTLIDQLVGANHLTAIEDVPTIITNIESGRADITILEEPVAMGVILTHTNLTYIKLTNGFNVNDKDIEVAIAIRKGSSDLLNKVNSCLASITDAEKSQMMETAIAKNAE